MKLTVKEHNTNPIIIHGNGTGRQTYTWENTIKYFRTTSKKVSNKFTVVSWKGGSIQGKKTILEESLESYGVNVLNLPWHPVGGSWKESQQKMTETLKAIKSNMIDTEYMFFLDNSDVAFIDSPDLVFDRYKQYFSNYNIVFSAERGNHPTPNHAKWNGSNPENGVTEMMWDTITEDNTYLNTAYKYLNAGAAFGKVSTFEKLLEDSISIMGNSRICDQALIRINQTKMKDVVCIDRECKIFFSCFNTNENDVIIEK